MVGDDYENVRNVGVAKVLARRKQVAEESAHNDNCPPALNSSLIRLFDEGYQLWTWKQTLSTN